MADTATETQPTPSITRGLRPPSANRGAARAAEFNDDLEQAARECFDVWAQYGGFKVDGRDFSFKRHRFLIDIYEASGDMTPGSIVAWRKPAQVGATTMEQLLLLWAARNHQMNAGFYFPGKTELDELAKARFQPLIASNPVLAQAIDPDCDTYALKRIKNVLGGWSNIYLRNIGGRSATESIPLDLVQFDEVRKYPDQQVIWLVLKRLQASDWKIARFYSTAGLPTADIDAWFEGGTQEHWLSRCLCPGDGGVDLAEAFPDSIGFDRHGRAYYRCPKCKAKIVDAQNGAYVSKRPGAPYRSFTCSAMVSPHVLPGQVWDEYSKTQDIEEFHRSTLGRPYVDRRNLPITDPVLDACTPSTWGGDPAFWAYQRPDLKHLRSRTYMGVDQGGNYLYITIWKRLADGRRQLVHFEVVESDNPLYRDHGKPDSQFRRFDELMAEFGVEAAVVDHYPNFAPALELAQRYNGRVFLSTYHNTRDVVRWRDREEDDPNTTAELQTPFQVDLGPYKAMDWALRLFVDRRIVLPNPDALVQTVRHSKSGRFVPVRIAQRFRKQLKAMVRHKRVKNNETREYTMEWQAIGEDHAAHAALYGLVACERQSQSGRIWV